MGHIFPYLAEARHAGGADAAGAAADRQGARRGGCARRRRGGRRRWLQGLVGTRQRVLVERRTASGHAENFAPVRVVVRRSADAHGDDRRR